VKRKVEKAKQRAIDIERRRPERPEKKRSIADAFDELRRIRGDEEPIEAPRRRNRPNEFVS
jgi:hypothetical protein